MAEATVVYRAIAEFSDLRKEVRGLKRDIRELTAQEAAHNAAAKKSQVAQTQREAAQATRSHGQAASNTTLSLRNYTQAAIQQASAVQRAARAQRDHTNALHETQGATTGAVAADRRLTQETISNATRRAAALRRERDERGRFVRAGAGGGGGGGGGDLNIPNPDPGGKKAKAFKDVGLMANFARSRILKMVGLGLIFGAIAGAIGPLIAVLGALGAAAFGVVGGLAQATGAALAMPAAFAVAATAVATLMVALKGITKVFQAYSQQQKAQAADAASSAAAQKASARQISDAQRSLARARRDAGEAAEDAAERVRDAERSLVSAQRNVLRAQQNLNRARQEALRNLIDLRREVSRGALDEESAVAALRQAQEDYAAVEADASSSAGDRMAALARMKQAEQDLLDVRHKRTQDAADLAQAEKEGVNGSERVKDAQEGLRDSEESLADAKRGLKDAQEDQARSARDSAERIADAQRSLARAYEDAQDAQNKTTAGANVFDEAMKNLSPSAQKFVLGLLAMKDAFKAIKMSVQEAFFKPLLRTLDDIERVLPFVRKNLTLVAGALGELAAQVVEFLTSDRAIEFFDALAKSTARIIETLTPAFINILGAFMNIIEAGLPFIERFAEWVAKGAESFRIWSEDTENLTGIMEKGTDRLSQFWEIIKNLAGAFSSLVKAADPFIDWVMNGFIQATQNFQDFADAQKIDGSPFKTYLEDIKPLINTINDLLGDFMGYLFGQMADPKNIASAIEILEKIRTELGPALADLLDVIRDKQLMQKFIDLITKITEALTALIEKSDGLDGFFKSLGAILDAFKWLIDNTPAPVLQAITMALGGLMALRVAQFAGKITGLAKAFQLLGGGKAVGGIKKLAGRAGGLLATGAGKTKVGGAMLGRASAGKGQLSKKALGKGAGVGAAAGIGGMALNSLIGGKEGSARDKTGDVLGAAGMGAGIGATIGSVIPGIGTAIGAAIGGLAGALYGTWKALGTDTILGWVDGVWEWLKGAGRWIGEQFTKYVINPFKDLFGINSPSTLFASFGRDIMTGLWNGLKAIFTTIVGWFASVPGKVVSALGDLLRLLYQKGKDLLQGLWNGAKFVFDLVKFWYIDLPKKILGFLGNVARTLFNKGKDLLQGLWDGGIQKQAELGNWIRSLPGKILGFLGNLSKTLAQKGRDLIQGFKDGITGAWSSVTSWISKKLDELKNLFKSPIRFIVNTVINGGLLGTLRKIPGIGGLVPGDIRLPFARGGRVPGTGSGDTVPAMLTPGEVVIKKSSVAAIGADNLLYANEHGRLPFALGGLVPNPIKDAFNKGKGALGKIGGAIGSGVDWVKEQARGLAGKALSAALTPLRALLNNFQPQFSGIPGRTGNYALDKVVNFVKGKDKETLEANNGVRGFAQSQAGKPYLMGGVGPDAYDCSGFMAALENVIKGRNPHRRLYSTASFANGPVSGWRSGSGGRLDIGVVQGRDMPGGIGHMSGTLPGGINVESRGGRGVLVGSAARGANDPLYRQHFALLAKGGMVKRRKGDPPFDLIDPKLGLSPLTGGAGFNSGGYVGTTIPLSGFPGGVQSVSNRTVTANSGSSYGDINIYNPAPERASDSLPRTVRKLAYLNTAGT